MSILVTKADGTTESFKVEKLRRSLRRSGATNEEVDFVVNKISNSLIDGMLTQEIYRRAFEILHNHELNAAVRYSLRRALFGLGPTGFPFEKFLAKLFETEGYTTRTNLQIKGRCVTHEIDIGAFKDDHSFVAEAKFHSRPGMKTDLQVVMYSYARLLDINTAKICEEDICGIHDFWMITNTKFTKTAISYGECVGLTILSWNYPKNNNLHDRIQKAGIYPVTVMQSLSTKQNKILIEKDVILCRDILKQPNILRHLHLEEQQKNKILTEAESLCTPYDT